MECRLRDFALVFLKWLMFKSFIIIGISKIEFLSFSGTDRVKKISKKFKTIRNLVTLWVNHFSGNINKFAKCFFFFYWNFKQNQKKFKTIQNLLSPYVNDFPSNINKFQIFFWFFSETLILLLTVRHWMGETTDLSLDSNISKTVKINVTFSHHF